VQNVPVAAAHSQIFLLPEITEKMLSLAIEEIEFENFWIFGQ
jgi:hypothetical protein